MMKIAFVYDVIYPYVKGGWKNASGNSPSGFQPGGTMCILSA